LLPRRKAPRHARQRRARLILKGFATLRVAQKPIPVPAKFGSLLRSNRIPPCGIANLFFLAPKGDLQSDNLAQKRYY